MRQLLTMADFRAVQAAGGFVLITDSANGDTVHKLPCPTVKAAYFEMKVIQNHGKNGAYFEVTAQEVATMRRCPNC